MPTVNHITLSGTLRVAPSEAPATPSGSLQRLAPARQTVEGVIGQFRKAAGEARMPTVTDATNSAEITARIARVMESVANVELTHVTDNDGLHTFNNRFTATMGRTLTQRAHDHEASASAGQIPHLAGKEFNILSNRLGAFKIVITPGTMIFPGGAINFISSKADRPEWYGLPSLVFTLPKSSPPEESASPRARGEWARARPDTDAPSHPHAGFAHFRSFASNRAFGENRAEKAAFAEFSRRHADAEIFRHLKSQVLEKRLIKTRPQSSNPHEQDTPVESITDFDAALRKWAQHEMRSGNAPMEHNEVATRLWPWDISHVAVGPPTREPHPDPLIENDQRHTQCLDAIQCAAVISIQRLRLAHELLTQSAGLGIEHPVLDDFLMHQASFGENGEPRTLEESRHLVDTMPADEKAGMVLSLAEKLLEKVSVITYQAGDDSFKSALSEGDLYPADLRNITDLATRTWQENSVSERLSKARATLLAWQDAFAQNRKDVAARLAGPDTASPQTLLGMIESMAPINLLHTHPHHALRRFNDGESAYMARSLIDATPEHQPPLDDTADAHLDQGRRLAQVEWAMLTNSLTRKGKKLDILITPTTALIPGVPIEVMSNPYAPRLERWAHNPTVMYQFATDPKRGENAELGHPRSVIGHVRSIKSNQAFTEAFAQQRESLSRTEAIGKLAEQIKTNWAFHSKEPDIPLSTGITELSEQLRKWGGSNPRTAAGTLPHNEVMMRVWPWDISHLAVGHISEESRDDPTTRRARFLQALGTAAELSQQRMNLARAFCTEGPGQGIDHPLFREALEHQFSNPEGEAPLTRSATRDALSSLSDDEKTTLLLGLAERLMEPVSMVTYHAGSKEFAPSSTMAEALITGDDIKSLNERWQSQIEK